MNSCALSLIVSSAGLVQSQYVNSLCAIANCWLVQVTPDNNTYEFPIQVRAWGADANNLANLQEHETILVLGELWLSQKGWWIESHGLVIGYRGAMINHISIVGRIGQEPETRYFTTGNCVSRTSLAVNRNKEETTWFNIQAWNKSGEVLAKYAHKGEFLGASGKLEINQWTDNNTGEIKQSLQVNSKIKLMSSKPKELSVA